jgi:hypothetical protein
LNTTIAPPKRVAIIQSNYIPWKGYFDIIQSVDEFILLDEVQYTRRDWRNRNLIKTSQGPQWLTIPVDVKSNFTIAIDQVKIADPAWGRKHWTTITNNYSRSEYFKEYKDQFADIYLNQKETYLSRINLNFITLVNTLLGIKTRISWSRDYNAPVGKTERLLSLCKATGASEYLSGPAAQGYLDEELFRSNGVAVSWMDYSNYPEYRQLFPPFVHGVSILDLLFNEGKNATRFMKGFNQMSQ